MHSVRGPMAAPASLDQVDEGQIVDILAAVQVKLAKVERIAVLADYANCVLSHVLAVPQAEDSQLA